MTESLRPGDDTSGPFGRPLGNTVHLPLSMAVMWSFVAAAAAAAIAVIVGLVATIAIAVASLFDPDVGAAIPWELIRIVALALVPVAFVAAVWTAAYGSGHARAGLRTLIGGVAGLAVLAVLAALDTPVLLLAGLAVAWAVAIPFEHWGRPGLRLVWPATAAVSGAILFPDPGPLLLAVLLALSPPVAAATVWLGDLIWTFSGRLRD